MTTSSYVPDRSGLTLILGSSGRLGRAAAAEFEREGLPVRGFDVAPALSDRVADFHRGSITDRAAVERAMTGATTAIHLAATPDDAPFIEELLPNNLLGVYHVMESARAAGVKRLVLASTGQVNWWQRERGPWPIRVDEPTSPKLWYAATKMFLESIGRSFWENYGMSVVIVRLGWCPRNAEQEQELASLPWGPDVYLSPGDAGRFFVRAVLAPHIGCQIVNVTSRPIERAYVDLEPARSALGFEPVDRWPVGTFSFDKTR